MECISCSPDLGPLKIGQATADGTALKREGTHITTSGGVLRVLKGLIVVCSTTCKLLGSLRGLRVKEETSGKSVAKESKRRHSRGVPMLRDEVSYLIKDKAETNDICHLL